MTRSSFACFLAVVLSLLVVPPAAAVSPMPAGHGSSAGVDPALLAGMKARAVGPATMSGRIAAIDVAAADPKTIYVGAATGGLWKSSDAGLTWKPVFEDQPVAAIGAVAVAAANPDVVWVGTGEGNPRNSVSVGNGIYRSRDGGQSWEHLGLDGTERIHRVLLDPTNPDVVWAAALGEAWGENPERGIFKTTDGGKTWTKVLYVDERTGAADLVMDPRDPRKLVAAMWDYRRWPWSFRSGGPGSGLFLTRDGGATWKRLTAADGLPEGELGRIGLAIAPSAPDRIYALVEAAENALYRSDDGGSSWHRISTHRLIGNRPFYYADLRVDPVDPNRVYSLWSMVSVSEDGGKTFRMLVPFRAAHPDHHAMWIDPADPDHLWEGNDGGVYESRDRGESWRFVANLPVGQYYHIRVDDETPYNLYGGMQDNGSWKGPSSVWENGGIRNHHWQEVGFGDGFDTAPLPGDPLRGFAMSQQGFLIRWDLRTGERKDVRPPAPEAAEGAEPVELRFNWNAALALDPFEAATIYYGSQFVHRSRDWGDSWEILSPDLTTNNPEWQKQAESGGLTLDVTGAENFTTVVAIAPSPVERGVIWVGSDDGRLHLTRDGGATWTRLDGNFRGVPADTWIPHIAPSPHDAATAFVVFDDHRRSNWTPYVFKTTDWGATWKNLATPDLWGYGLTIAQDPVDPDLLFLGTEFGLWVSLDGGGSWMKWTHGVPTVSVMDLAIQPRMSDLVLGTHGRAAFVLDDIAPLRELTKEILAQPIHLFAIPPAQQYEVAQTGSSRFPGAGEFRGENREYGALITVSLNAADLPHPDADVERERKAEKVAAKQAEKGEAPEEAGEKGGDAEGSAGKDAEGPKAKVEIADAAGETIRSFEAPVELGINRVFWDLRYDSFKEPPRPDMPRFFEPRGPEVLPGTYSVTVRYGEAEATGEVEVLADSRVESPRADREAKLAATLHAGALQEALASAIERIQDTRKDVAAILEKAGKADAAVGSKADSKAGSKPDSEATGEAMEAADPAAEGSDGGPHEALIRAGRELRKGLGELEKSLWVSPDTKGIPADETPWRSVSYIQRSLGSSYAAPTASQQAYLREAEAKTAAALADFNRFFAEEVAAFRARVRASDLELLPEHAAVAVKTE